MAFSYRPGKEVKISEAVETITPLVTQPIAGESGESRPFRDSPKNW